MAIYYTKIPEVDLEGFPDKGPPKKRGGIGAPRAGEG